MTAALTGPERAIRFHMSRSRVACRLGCCMYTIAVPTWIAATRLRANVPSVPVCVTSIPSNTFDHLHCL